jgi:hypothetical protein
MAYKPEDCLPVGTLIYGVSDSSVGTIFGLILENEKASSDVEDDEVIDTVHVFWFDLGENMCHTPSFLYDGFSKYKKVEVS